MVRRLARSLIALTSVMLVFLVAPEASAKDKDQITRMDIAVTVDSQGTAKVVNTFDVTYASQGHGPYLTFVVRQPYEGMDFDAGWVRLYDYDIVSVTSPTGAPTALSETESNGVLSVRVGDAGTYVSGTHTYIATYTIKGLLNTRNAESGLDELYWNILGGAGSFTGWAMDLQNLTVTIENPVTPTLANCWATGGIGDDDQCADFDVAGTRAVFHTDTLIKYGNLTLALGFPAGTFPDTKPVLRATLYGRLAWKPDLVGYGAGAVSVVIAIIAVVLLARKGRDEQYADLAPGDVPPKRRVGKPVEDTGFSLVADVDAPTLRAEIRNPPVFFTPPPDMTPALACALAREKADSRDVTATIVDLAVRNYLTIASVNDGRDFALNITTRPWVGLTAHEIAILNALFREGPDSYPLVTSQDGLSTIRSRWHGYAARLSAAVIPCLIMGGILSNWVPWMVTLFVVPLVLGIVCVILGFVLASQRRSELAGEAAAHELKDDVLGHKLSEVIDSINAILVRDGYYKQTPVKVCARWVKLGRRMIWLSLLVSCVVGFAMGYFGYAGWGLTGLGVTVFGVGCILIAPRMSVRTPTGSAMAARALGFKRYLMTAEADQIAWEERNDIFSRYLPYAIGFNCVDRWAKVFEDAVGTGLAADTTAWFGAAGGSFDAGEFSRSIHSISDSARYKPSVWSSSGGGGVWSSSDSSSSGGGSGSSGSSGSSGGGSSGSGGGTW